MQAAGYGPPSAASVLFGVRRSIRMLAAPVEVRREMVGSVVMPASILPWPMAAMKLEPAPTGKVVNSLFLTLDFAARNWVRKLVDEPRPVTPRVLPLKSAGDLMRGAATFDTRITSPGAWLNCTTDSTSLPRACKSNV